MINAIAFLEGLYEKCCQKKLLDLVICAVNGRASLDIEQQKFVKEWFEMQPIKNVELSYKANAACSLATYINTCHD